jgi:glutaredoxin 3
MIHRSVKVFTIPSCRWCSKLIEFLESNKIEFHEYNIAEDMNARREMLKIINQIAVPTTVISGEYITGYNEQALKSKLGLN